MLMRKCFNWSTLLLQGRFGYVCKLEHEVDYRHKVCLASPLVTQFTLPYARHTLDHPFSLGYVLFFRSQQNASNRFTRQHLLVMHSFVVMAATVHLLVRQAILYVPIL